MTAYNLPCQLAAESRKGKRATRRPDGGGNCSLAVHATPRGRSRPGPAPDSPPCPGAGRRLPALPGPSQDAFPLGRTPALASSRAKAGQFSPLLRQR